MIDLMFRADGVESWRAFGATLPEAAVVDEIGPIDGDGRYHVNVRVPDDGEAARLAVGGNGVEWINPATVDHPRRVWAGGMNYWRGD